MRKKKTQPDERLGLSRPADGLPGGNGRGGNSPRAESKSYRNARLYAAAQIKNAGNSMIKPP
jgi:hypothetical protein